jgi:hypothetical protein
LINIVCLNFQLLLMENDHKSRVALVSYVTENWDRLIFYENYRVWTDYTTQHVFFREVNSIIFDRFWAVDYDSVLGFFPARQDFEIIGLFIGRAVQNLSKIVESRSRKKLFPFLSGCVISSNNWFCKFAVFMTTNILCYRGNNRKNSTKQLIMTNIIWNHF